MRAMMKRLISLVVLFTLSVVASAAPNYTKITYIHPDGLGNPAAASDEQGNLEWQIEYYPYGAEYSNNEVRREADISFAGKAHDEEIGLSYFGGRWYDPDLGRFTGIDPMPVNAEDWRTFNRYSYGFNNPYRYIDPDGNMSVLTGITMAAAVIVKYRNQIKGSYKAVKKRFGKNSSKNTGDATNRVKVVDRDGDVVELAAKGKNGNISVITQMNKKGDDLILKGTHIDGGGRGSSSISELKGLAKDLGRQQGAKNVIVEGGKRTTGANPGKTPRPIKIKVD